MSNLAELLAELGMSHFGELNLVLHVMTDTPRDRQTIASAIYQYSGATDQIPKPNLYIDVSLEIGLLEQNNHDLELTQLGRRLKNISTNNIDRFTNLQLKLLSPEILGHPDLREHVVGALDCFEKSIHDNNYLLKKNQINTVEALGLQVLQAFDLTCYRNLEVISTSTDIEFIREIVGPFWAVTEEELHDALALASKRSKAAEEYVISFEKLRLGGEGHADLAELVTRASATNARSPYDIRSYNADASPRFIEVKSSVNSTLIFYWTASERRFASVKCQSYWLYYIPRSQELPELSPSLILIQDPIRLLGTRLTEECESYRVRAIGNYQTSPGGVAGFKVITIE
ncbi:DUF3883 domain-containing protein [Dehalogenimonas etheniformans]|uniref:DUF3883 domain-containing protein n=1 Tax=Dehalogenimonas etheniformans TaxID=1536648 RepID=A0A2P5P800_9CHLR|nr:DUF3883 domain-containing protein [Dehalogenimonas etheniformans]PPD58433.1 DUF3883 domain-containing protein [Dehalogenimonas etheniformans]QNT75883.1 DUF3883 domain-containing protein [Dehalogenimonas etheniformans]